MKSAHDKPNEPDLRKTPENEPRSDEHVPDKVPESAENFEHTLRRITLEKAKAKLRQ